MARKMEETPGKRPPHPFNPRMIVLLRNDEGEILNGEQIGTRFLNDFSEDLPFLPETVDTIQTTKLGSDYVFRSLLYKNNDGTYTELLISIEAERNVVENFIEILAVCTIIFVLLSITASYVLAKRSMRPIINAWNKQSEFVENASHELRTPLAIVQSKLEFLLTKPNSTIAGQFESIGLSLSEIKRMNKMTSYLLTLARADSMEQLLQKEEVNISELVTDAAHPFIEMAELEEKELIIQTHSSQIIHVDKARIHQLLIILLDNALKYTNTNDKIYVVVKNNLDHIQIEVSDTGVGIKPENLNRVFDRFYREDTARALDNRGTGLGLSIAQWIVESHKGKIKVFPNSPKGTIVQITFPSKQD